MDDSSGEVGEIRPCLIGGFRDKIAISGVVGLLPESSGGVPRFGPYSSPDGSISSLDMVRLRLKFGGGDDFVARFEDRVQRLNSLKESYSMNRSRPGRFAHLYTLEYGESAVALGVGQFVKGVQADMGRGFIEFNPNKLGYSDGFGDFVRLVGSNVTRCELARYDFAVDLPVDRSLVRTRKDRRRYEFVQGSALTEYLGSRNTVGRVKVYDKAAELGLGGVGLTRVELTCSGEWSVQQVSEKWPTIYRVDGTCEGVSDANAALALAVADLIGYGESPEKYLGGLNYRRRKAVRGLLEGYTYPCPVDGAVHVLLQAAQWASRLSGREVA